MPRLSSYGRINRDFYTIYKQVVLVLICRDDFTYKNSTGRQRDDHQQYYPHAKCEENLLYSL